MLQPGTLVGRYQIERRLGRGGMGTLYVAIDPVLARPVALKLFLGDIDSSDYRERFAREARAVAALNHPHIVTVHDYGEFAAQPFIVMELIDGHTLPELLSTPLSVEVPAGTYRVSLQGPPPEGGDRQLEVQVVAGQVVPVPALEFSPLTPAMYFEPYIALPNGGSER